ncbi:hypothetical protein [Mycolicibacterium mageritense]|uniref:hypothetical protein n=1 Tax=Mycolicibacterium mageritense TaxID=53462 RepID=UPI001E3CA729|nr:hypothetical protein [Mycolicibacterium mageritense]GJJ24092.1 hypothetical protein MTY414_77660 [Mycolicibacterium mageritense]
MPTWKINRANSAPASLSVSNGNIAALPGGFYSAVDYAEDVTANPDGSVTINTAGDYEIAALFTAGIGYGMSQVFKPAPWVLYRNGVASAGPVAAGAAVTVHLDAGDIVKAGVASLFDASDGSPASVKSVGGGAAASFLGRAL